MLWCTAGVHIFAHVGVFPRAGSHCWDCWVRAFTSNIGRVPRPASQTWQENAHFRTLTNSGGLQKFCGNAGEKWLVLFQPAFPRRLGRPGPCGIRLLIPSLCTNRVCWKRRPVVGRTGALLDPCCPVGTLGMPAVYANEHLEPKGPRNRSPSSRQSGAPEGHWIVARGVGCRCFRSACVTSDQPCPSLTSGSSSAK